MKVFYIEPREPYSTPASSPVHHSALAPPTSLPDLSTFWAGFLKTARSIAVRHDDDKRAFPGG